MTIAEVAQEFIDLLQNNPEYYKAFVCSIKSALDEARPYQGEQAIAEAIAKRVIGIE